MILPSCFGLIVSVQRIVQEKKLMIEMENNDEVKKTDFESQDILTLLRKPVICFV